MYIYNIHTHTSTVIYHLNIGKAGTVFWGLRLTDCENQMYLGNCFGMR